MKESIELHTIGTFRGKEYEMQDLMNGLLEKIEEKDKEIERLNNIINKGIETLGEWTIFETSACTDRIISETLDILKRGDKK